MHIKKHTNKFKKIAISFVLVVGLFTSACSGIMFNLFNTYGKSVYAENVESIDKSSSFISNYNFSSTSSSSTPPSANGWTKITDDNVLNPENVVSGVFNSYDATLKTDENYLDNYKILESPGHATNQTNLESTNALYKSLMINSYTDYAILGYKSPNFTLEADSYYVFEVVLKTVTADNESNEKNTGKNYSNFDSRASIYLTDSENNNIIGSFELVDSNDNTTHVVNGYARYKMYVATKTFDSTSANLQLYLGSKDEGAIGPVFFNNVKISQLSQSRYLEETNIINQTSTKVFNLNSTLNNNVVENATFDVDWRKGWTLISKGNNGVTTIETIDGNNAYQADEFISANLGYGDVPYTNNSSIDNKFVLFMHNSEDNYVGIESSEITIKQHGYYKLNVWAWSNSQESTSPVIKLVDKSDRELNAISTSVSTSTTSSTTLTNGWTKHSFYICGDPYKDVTVALQLWLGTDKEHMSSGYVFYDDITMQSLSYNEYSSNKNSNELNYSNTSSSSITNSTFDITNNDGNTTVYPLAPNSWSANISKEYAKSGIINIKDENFVASDLQIGSNALPSKPADLPTTEYNASNNVLMIASAQENLTQSYSSTSTTLSEQYYTLSLWYNTTNGGVGVKLYNDDQYIYNIQGLSSNGWQKLEFVIKKDTNSINLNVELSLSGVCAYAYFDEINLLTASEDYFNSVTNSTFVKKIDLTSTNFENTYDDNSEVLPLNGYNVVTTNPDAQSGIVNLSKSFAGLTSDEKNKYALMVSSESDVYYYLESVNEFNFSAGSYYKLTVDVLTHDLRSENENYGARIFLSGEGLDKEFVNIKTNGWKTYTFLINSTTSTFANLQLGLGNEVETSSGFVFFDNITLSTLNVTNEEEFNNLASNYEFDDQTLVINSTETTEVNEEEKAETDDEDNNSNIWYIIPSLISAIALIFAIVVTFARKIKWNKPRRKKTKTAYDRKHTLEKDLDRKEKIELRKQMINELEVQLKELNDEIARYLEVINEKEKANREKLANEHKELVAKKNKITAEKESLLRERNAKIAQDKKAFTAKEEEDFLAYIKKLELKEAKEQQAIVKKELALKQNKERKDAKLQKYLQKQEAIKKEIERIDKEIEELAREEAQIWEEYKRAKQEAKLRKAEYKKQIKEEKITSKKSKTTNKDNSATETKTEVEIKKPKNSDN